MERRTLQVTLGVLSLIPLLGLIAVWGWGPQLFLGKVGGRVPTNLDSQLRYLAGVYLGSVSFGLWWALGRIEERGGAVLLVGVAVFMGGVGRVVSILSVGWPSDPSMIVGLGLELVVAPCLILWQRRIARLSGRSS